MNDKIKIQDFSEPVEKSYISADDVRRKLSNLKQITFEVTDACNLKCKYCGYGEFYDDYDLRTNRKMGLSIALKVIDYLVNFWNSEQNMSANRNVFISFYGGEPLLNMPLIESVVDYMEKLPCRNRKFVFSMTTNALLIERYMDFLVAHNFYLHISLDGNEYNTSYRVDKSEEPAFRSIIENVNALKAKYPDYFEDRVNFNAVLHNRNSVGDIYDYFKSNFNKIPGIVELNNMGIRPDKVALFQKTYRNSRESLYQAENYETIEQDMFIRLGTYQSVNIFLHQYSGHVYYDYIDLLFGQREKTVPTGTCLPFGKKMYVTVNGKILPCERIGQQFALGNVTESGVELDLQAISDRYNAYFAKLDTQCSKCYNTKACIQCIYNLHHLEDNPVCQGYMDEPMFAAYKARQMDFLRKHPEDYYRIMENVIVE